MLNTRKTSPGLINAIVSPAFYAQERHLGCHIRLLVDSGRLQREYGTINIIAQTIRPIAPSRLPGPPHR